MPRHLVIAFALAFAAPAVAADAPPFTGVWTGTLGKQNISACFSGDDLETQYYYHRHGSSIALANQGGAGDTWLECNAAAGSCDKPTGRWKLARSGPDALEGTWSDPEGKRTQPIRLTRVATKERDLCHGEAFNGPRLDAQKRVTESATAFGKSYKIIRLASTEKEKPAIATIELPAGGAGSSKINAMLARNFREYVTSYFECRLAPYGGSFEARVEPIFWNDRFISLSASVAADCGGAHPSASTDRSTWDLASGNQINPWLWIQGSRKKDADPQFDAYSVNYAAPERLNAIILERAGLAQMDQDCRGVVEENRDYQLSLTQTGLRFSTEFPHVVQACDIEVELPWSKLLPFLSPQGRKVAEELAPK